MGNVLYLDIFSGISGDMFIGALLDLGIDQNRFAADLELLNLDGYHLHISRKSKSSIEGIKFDVHLAHDPHAPGTHSHTHENAGHAVVGEHGHSHSHDDDPGHSHSHQHGEGNHGHSHSHSHAGGEEQHRSFRVIRRIIEQSALSPWVKERSIAVFRRVAEAEGKIHGHPPDEVHFHEVGAIDSIVDIVGACLALELLGKPRVLASPVVEGTGWVNCAHGRFPVPTTATLEILGARGIALTQCEEPHELVTPTGAAILAEFAEAFGPMSGLVARKVGYGLGTRDNKTRPNVLRAVLGEASETLPSASLDWETDTVVVLETNLDDATAEVIAYASDKILAAGALDVFHTAIVMKKNRPAVLLTVLCAAGDADCLTEMMLRETTAFGVRRTSSERRKLRREFKKVSTRFGEVQVKLGLLSGKIVQTSPEFEDCRALAEKEGVPIREVYQAALQGLK